MKCLEKWKGFFAWSGSGQLASQFRESTCNMQAYVVATVFPDGSVALASSFGRNMQLLLRRAVPALIHHHPPPSLRLIHGNPAHYIVLLQQDGLTEGSDCFLHIFDLQRREWRSQQVAANINVMSVSTSLYSNSRRQCVYAIGGVEEASRPQATRTAWRLDFMLPPSRTRDGDGAGDLRWEALPEMCEKRAEPVVLVMEGDLYAIGGYNGGAGAGRFVNSGEVLKVGSQQWELAPQLFPSEVFGEAGCMPKMAALGGSFLFALREDLGLLQFIGQEDEQWRLLGHVPDDHGNNFAACCQRCGPFSSHRFLEMGFCTLLVLLMAPCRCITETMHVVVYVCHLILQMSRSPDGPPFHLVTQSISWELLPYDPMAFPSIRTSSALNVAPLYLVTTTILNLDFSGQLRNNIMETIASIPTHILSIRAPI
ncbi:hypothetical protein GOP47_0014887 [Adiantum capillus-veneris]|uniref:Uncharacterized protein n=1 Tax=Adiantum capillus-veneris TaxID=13818 RepID=A0A9D4UMY0_ADICA|nr:hypothetical protein GOP47_0014887 [Adiantum capillus-veneris]